MRYTALALVPLLLVGCGGGGSRRGSSQPPAGSTQPQESPQLRSISAEVARPQSGADCIRLLQVQATRATTTVGNVQVQTTPTGFSCTGQLGAR